MQFIGRRHTGVKFKLTTLEHKVAAVSIANTKIVYKRFGVILSEAKNLGDSSSSQFVGTPQNDIDKRPQYSVLPRTIGSAIIAVRNTSMKWLILILLLSSLALGCAPPQPPAPQQLPTPEIPEQVEVAVGEVFTIPLTSNPSTGYDWTVKHNAAMIEYLGHDSKPFTVPPAPGDQVYRTYKFKALKVGETKITLIYEQSKERGFAVSEVAEIIEVPVTIPQPPAPQQLPTPKILDQVKVAVGEVFNIPLTSNPSTGYDWTVKHDPAMIEYLDYDCQPVRMPPAPGDQSYCGYKFKALKVGETKITLIYERSKEHGFEVSEVAEIIEVPVNIQ